MPPTTNADLVYNVTSFGVNAPLEAALAGVALPQDVLSALGLLVKTDVTSAGGGFVLRTINLGLVATAAATATAQLLPGATKDGSPVAGLTLVGPGSGYAAPPYVRFANAVGDTTGKGAKGRAALNVASVTVSTPGSLYVAPTVKFVGGLGPKGVAATGTVLFALGAVTGVVVLTPGSGYTGVPAVVITDSAGSGAVATAVLQVSGLTLDAGGSGYQAAPTVTLLDAFKAYFPDGVNQTRALNNLFTVGLQKGSKLQVIAAAPIIT